MSKRQYDFVLLGATGYTGKLTAEYITKSLPTNIQWAVAGRNQSKLESLVADLQKLNSDRAQPDILAVELTKADLEPLAKKTKLILNTVGPYHLYSTPVVEACANNGTHYLDVTGETPWVKEIIEKYDKTAKAKGALIIPEVGIESAPSDLLAYVATALVRKVWDCGVMDMISAVTNLKTSGASGGTLATGLGLLDHYPAKEVSKARKDPFVLSASQFRPEPTSYTRTGLQKLTGVWEYPGLGLLTTSITSFPNVAIVQRSASLTPLFYGFNFTYEEYMRTSNAAVGILIHFAIAIFALLLSLPPFRMLMKRSVYQPGTGPAMESSTNDVLEYKAIAVAEQLGKPRKALATFRYDGGLYHLTAILLAEAGMALLEGTAELQKKYTGGVLTPSCLGDKYVERLQKAGVKIDVKQMGAIGSK